MVSMDQDQQDIQATISRKALFTWGATLLLLFGSLVVIPIIVATSGQGYPNLDTPLLFCSGLGFFWVGIARELGRQTTFLRLDESSFTIKKWWQTPKQFNYSDIIGWNERPNPDRGKPSKALTFYLKDDFFVIKSNEFADYNLLKDRLCPHAKAVPYQKVITLSERNRLRWLIGGLTLLITANIAFGYLAHNPTDKNPVKLLNVSGMIDRVTEDRPKGHFKGARIFLRTYPDFVFYVSRRVYTTNIQYLKSVIRPNQLLTLFIRESDYRKKIAQTEPLTFGDKFSNYRQIMVYGLTQGKWVNLQSDKPVYEPTHTNPLQRTFFSCILLLICWSGWVYADQHKILRAD